MIRRGVLGQRAFHAGRAMPDRGKHAFDQFRRALMIPVIGRKIEKGQHLFAIPDQAFDGHRVFRRVFFGKCRHRSLRSCAARRLCFGMQLGLTLGSVGGCLAVMTRAWSGSCFLRPYIWRFTSLSLVICPSIWPLDHGEVIAAMTAALSLTTPLAKEAIKPDLARSSQRRGSAREFFCG